ncbi:MAG: thrombospondin type 3 repeat-containing protein, partial [Byssovorax sp.]
MVGQTNLDFGDGPPLNGNVIGMAIGSGTDAVGGAYTVTRYTATHTYAAAGTYTAFFQGSNRLIGLQNGSNGSFRVETKVGLAPGNTSGPVSAAPAIIQMQTGGVRTYTFPAFDPDGDVVTCRFATSAEMWSSNTGADGPIPPAAQDIPSAAGKIPTLSNGPTGCVVTWDLTTATPGLQYVIHLVLESTHGGQVSSTAIDLIIELVSAPPPTCAGSGTFTANVGQVFTTSTTGTLMGGGNLTMNATNAPALATIVPASGMSGPSPLTNVFTWTPLPTAAGTTQIVVMNYTGANNITGTCFLTIQVPQCLNFGAACTVGMGECQKTGTNVCAGPGVTVCSVMAGLPSAEICDGKDNNCNGMTDEGNPGGGVACVSGSPGVCAAGTTACTAGALGCTATITPGSQMETCDTLDNDCNGTVDEGFNLGMVCSSGVGACTASGVLTCNAMGTSSCNAVPGLPVPELCNDALDNDCDGAVNNGCMDSDMDGLPDDVEVAIGTNPNDADSDDDGVSDGQEPNVGEDSDGDGLIN